MSKENRKLASIQKIKALDPIEGADRIECASVLGWKVVVQKGLYEVGELVVYFEIDSILPRAEWNDFLADKNKPDKPIRLKTIKLRGQVSQGLCVPIDKIINNEDYVKYLESKLKLGITTAVHFEGDDLTDYLKVEKYVPEIPACLSGEVKGARPSCTVKTDEDRVQAYPEIIEEFQGKLVYVSQKIDGTSGTYCFNNGEFDVAGRNWAYKDTTDNTYWEMAKKYDIEAKLKKIYDETGVSYAIQGEVAGQGIQKNRLGLIGHELFVFNVMVVNGRRFLGFYEFKEFCERLQLQTVPILQICKFEWESVEDLLELAKGKYPSGKPQEGVVIRPVEPFSSKVLNGRASFKVINNDFLLKGGD